MDIVIARTTESLSKDVILRAVATDQLIQIVYTLRLQTPKFEVCANGRREC